MPHQDFNGLVVRVSMRIEIVYYGATVFLTVSVSAAFPER
jgi:hypothetical protein